VLSKKSIKRQKKENKGDFDFCMIAQNNGGFLCKIIQKKNDGHIVRMVRKWHHAMSQTKRADHLVGSFL
jgi:hypothetical protein